MSRIDEKGCEFFYYETIEKAEHLCDTEFCIAEMPDNSYVMYNKILYKIICYIPGKIKCENQNTFTIEFLDPSENGYYLGKINKKRKLSEVV